MTAIKFANFLSLLFGPFLLLILFFVFMFKTGLNVDQLKILLPSTFVFGVIVPASYLYLAPKLGWAESWELIQRKERYAFIGVTSISLLILLAVVIMFGNSLLQNIFMIFLVVIGILFVITFFWKVSMHVALNTFTAIMINFLYGWSMPWLYLIIPAIVWARFKLKRHTPAQLLVGFLVAAIPTFLGLHFFGYI